MAEQAEAKSKEGQSKDLLTRLTDAGEEAIQKLADVPGGRRVVDAMSSMRERIDDLQLRMRRLDELEQRVAALEAASAKPAAGKRTTTGQTTSRSPGTPTQKS